MAEGTAPSILAYRDGTQAHARLVGPLNRESAPQVQRRLDALVATLNSTAPAELPRPRGEQQARRSVLTLDLGQADYLDSDGVRWLQRYRADLRERDVTLMVAVRQGTPAERTLRLLRLEQLFQLHRYPTEDGSAALPRTPDTGAPAPSL